MNERIRELAEQALKSSMVHDGVYRPEGCDNNVSKVFADKFAELIVKECIVTIENAENGYQDYRNQIEDGMRNHCIWLIKDKFGVEE